MILNTRISQEDYDLVFSQLRKDPITGEALLSVERWLQEALNGKINNCAKRANPVAVLEKENAVLRAEKEKLSRQLSRES